MTNHRPALRFSALDTARSFRARTQARRCVTASSWQNSSTDSASTDSGYPNITACSGSQFGTGSHHRPRRIGYPACTGGSWWRHGTQSLAHSGRRAIRHTGGIPPRACRSRARTRLGRAPRRHRPHPQPTRPGIDAVRRPDPRVAGAIRKTAPERTCGGSVGPRATAQKSGCSEAATTQPRVAGTLGLPFAVAHHLIETEHDCYAIGLGALVQ